MARSPLFQAGRTLYVTMPMTRKIRNPLSLITSGTPCLKAFPDKAKLKIDDQFKSCQ
ncbi:hypothetical protein [Chlorobaculum sp. 24CR]|uniref:hypothetical protein n=1 Tax=Chlorobaculum sp. 24CR TaxID=2508878 RepID=UPI0014316522|nr:hypothetical protein [Chlorobaculum sp. 24CR]